MGLGQLIRTSRKNLTERREKWCDHVAESLLENDDTNPCGTSVGEQIMKSGRGGCSWRTSTREKNAVKKYHCSNSRRWGVRGKEDEKVEKYQDLASGVRGMCVGRTRVIIGND